MSLKVSELTRDDERRLFVCFRCQAWLRERPELTEALVVWARELNAHHHGKVHPNLKCVCGHRSQEHVKVGTNDFGVFDSLGRCENLSMGGDRSPSTDCLCVKFVSRNQPSSVGNSALLTGVLTVQVTERVKVLKVFGEHEAKDQVETRRYCADCATILKDVFRELGFNLETT